MIVHSKQTKTFYHIEKQQQDKCKKKEGHESYLS